MIRAYISGEMDGKPEDKERFKKAEDTLNALGIETVNPAEIFKDDKLLGYAGVLLFDMWMISGCNAIYMLPDWKESRRARAEKAFAEAIGLCVMYDKGSV